MQSYDTREFPYSQMRSSQKFPTPRGGMEGRIDSRMVGPGVSVVEFSGIVDTLNLPVTTPISADQCIIRSNLRFNTIGDAETTRKAGTASVRAVYRQGPDEQHIRETHAHPTRTHPPDNRAPSRNIQTE